MKLSLYSNFNTMTSQEQETFFSKYTLQRLNDLKEITKKVRTYVPKLKKNELTPEQQDVFKKAGISLKTLNALRKLSKGGK